MVTDVAVRCLQRMVVAPIFTADRLPGGTMATRWKQGRRLPGWFATACWAGEIFAPITLGILSIVLATTDILITAAVLLLGALALCGAVIPRAITFNASPGKHYFDQVLEYLGKEIWKQSPEKLDGPIEHHRITLFEAIPRYERVVKFAHSRFAGWLRGKWWARWCVPAPWTHKLVPRTRVPPSSQSPDRSFRAHTHEIEKCEGIAGMIYWSGDKPRVSPTLPDLRAGNCDEADCIEYARNSNDNVEIIRRKRYQSRRIGGQVVYANGQKWGVLVLDTKDPCALSLKEVSGKATERTVSLLTGFLEGHPDGDL